MQSGQDAFTFICDTDKASQDLAPNSPAAPVAADVMSDRYVTVAPSDTLLDVTSIISESRAFCAVVMREGTLLGVLTRDDILRDVSAGADLQHVTVETCLHPSTQSASLDAPIVDVAELMERKQITYLPVFDGACLKGVVTYERLAGGLIALHPLKSVGDILTKPAVTIDTGATVAEVSEIMVAQKTPCAVALHQRVPAGIVTAKDVLRRVVSARRDPMTTQVVEIMSFPLITIPPNYSILSTAQKMRALRLCSLVVMTEDELHGVVTEYDVLKALRSEIDWILGSDTRPCPHRATKSDT